MRVLDLTGQRFGRLVVSHRVENTIHGRSKWMCNCDCGNSKEIPLSSLRSGFTSSCGCYRAECISNRSLKHGKTGTSEYNIWANMIARCCDKNNSSYDRYGGRGIVVCDRWRNFEKFIHDMGDRPSLNHSLDRIDNNKGYYKENCRWATKKEQARNRRTSKIIEYNGQKKCLAEWVEIYNITCEAYRVRINKGWSLDKIFKTPLRGVCRLGKLIDLNGVSLNMSSWSKISGNSVFTINRRIKRGWNIKDAVFKPSGKINKKI